MCRRCLTAKNSPFHGDMVDLSWSVLVEWCCSWNRTTAMSFLSLRRAMSSPSRCWIRQIAATLLDFVVKQTMTNTFFLNHTSTFHSLRKIQGFFFFSAISVSVLAVFTCFPNSRGGSTKVLKKCDYIKLSLLCLNSTKVKVPIKTSARAKVKQYFIWNFTLNHSNLVPLNWCKKRQSQTFNLQLPYLPHFMLWLGFAPYTQVRLIY